MAIDPSTETLISLTEAAKLLPRRRGGRKPHVSTLYRWSIGGCKGVILETIQVGGTRCTSRPALARFFRRLTERAGTAPTSPCTPARRKKRVKRAISELIHEGV